MLSLPSLQSRVVAPPRHWKAVPATEAATMIASGSTVAVGWLGDSLATAIEREYLGRAEPRDLTIVYSGTQREGRTRGMNHLAHAGMVRRVIGGQWHPVPALHALASADQIESYSLPAGIIRRLFRDTAAGLAGHITRSGLGTFTDPRHGGGRMNSITRQQLARVVRAAGEETLLFRTFPIDVALVAVAFMEGNAAIAMARDAVTIARAAHASGGLVIAQMDRVGTLNKLPLGYSVVPDSLVDILVEADQKSGRQWATFSPVTTDPRGQRLLTE